MTPQDRGDARRREIPPVCDAVWPVLLALMLIWSRPASAHRLDDLLEAATLSVASDGISLQLRLTPGIAVADEMLGTIDADGDGRISAQEWRGYARAVARDLFLTVDDHPVPLHLVALAASPLPNLRAGTGDVVIYLAASAPLRDARHRLAFVNRHGGARAVYLANVLVPRNPRLGIVAQQRSTDQSAYVVEIGPIAADVARDSVSREAASSGWSLVGVFFRHGVRHILTGYDHLLFGMALVLGATGLIDLVTVVTAFTVAHSLTLALATFGFVHVSERIVEPVIAGSIVVVALLNLGRGGSQKGRLRPAVAFAFGLFHGLGFAGGLLDMLHGLPAALALKALAGFSMGIEAGNQLVLLPCFVLLALFDQSNRSQSHPSTPLMRRSASALIAFIGMVYLGQLLAG